jgi:hypothetical protein
MYNFRCSVRLVIWSRRAASDLFPPHSSRTRWMCSSSTLARLRDAEVGPIRGASGGGLDAASIITGGPSRLSRSARFSASTTDAALTVPMKTIRHRFRPGTPAVRKRATLHLKELTEPALRMEALAITHSDGNDTSESTTSRESPITVPEHRRRIFERAAARRSRPARRPPLRTTGSGRRSPSRRRRLGPSRSPTGCRAPGSTKCRHCLRLAIPE